MNLWRNFHFFFFEKTAGETSKGSTVGVFKGFFFKSSAALFQKKIKFTISSKRFFLFKDIFLNLFLSKLLNRIHSVNLLRTPWEFSLVIPKGFFFQEFFWRFLLKFYKRYLNTTIFKEPFWYSYTNLFSYFSKEMFNSSRKFSKGFFRKPYIDFLKDLSRDSFRKFCIFFKFWKIHWEIIAMNIFSKLSREWIN